MVSINKWRCKRSRAFAQHNPICAYLRLTRVNCRNYMIEGPYKIAAREAGLSKSRQVDGFGQTTTCVRIYNDFVFSPLTSAKLLIVSFIFTVPCPFCLLPVKGKYFSRKQSQMKMLVTKLSHGKYANEGQLFAEPISDSNVKLMGKMIALQAFRTVMPYDYEVVSKLYNGLIKDLNRI